MTSPTQTPNPDVAALVKELDAKSWQSRKIGSDKVAREAHVTYRAARLIERLIAERDEARAENVRWLLRMEAIREASGVGVLPMLSDLPDAIAAKMADHIVEADGVDAAEIVEEWLAMVGTFTPENLTRVRHVPVCQSEVEAIREILAALQAGEGR